MSNTEKTLSSTPYILKSKDTPLIDISFELVSAEPSKRSCRYRAQKIYKENSHLLPKEITASLDRNNSLNQAFMDWVEKRQASRHRINEPLFCYCSENNRYLEIGYGLSFNDTYWLVPKDKDLKWKDWSPYQNPLDKDISKLIFQRDWDMDFILSIEKKSRITTEPTTAGALRKCWVNKSDGIYLRKGVYGPRKNNRSVINMEYYAAQVAEVMGLSYVPYNVCQYTHDSGETEMVCECPLFTSEDIGFVPAISVIKASGIKWEKAFLDTGSEHRKFAELFGEDFYADMMLFDSIILNSDRHLGNFGMLVDNNTGEYLGAAPLFDNGSSWMVLEWDVDSVGSNAKNMWMYSGAYLICDVAAYYFVQKRHLPILRKLKGFYFKQPEDPSVAIDQKTLDKMSEIVQKRAKRIIRLYWIKKYAKLRDKILRVFK